MTLTIADDVMAFIHWIMLDILMLPFRFQYLNETADSLSGLPFKLHDFGFRGSTSVEVCVKKNVAVK